MNGNGKIKGRVKFYSRIKGYGFIAADIGGGDVFVHAKDLPSMVVELTPNQRVSFTLEQNQRGPRARNLEVLDLGRPVPPHGSGP